MADFGLYGPMYAHLARDPAPEMLMKRTANRVWRWVERMTAVGADMPEFPFMDRNTLADDAISETLMDVLKVMGRQYGPEVAALVDFINDYSTANPDIEPGSPVITDARKRVLGRITIPLGGAEVSVGARHYSLWMLQRIHDAYDSLDTADRDTVDATITAAGLTAFIDHRLTRRIKRKHYTDVWA